MWLNLPFLKSTKSSSIKPVVLVVLDGFGIAPPSPGNSITLARTPNYDYFKRTFPSTELIASGESVGLPANEVGNTEVGHLTMGAGRVIFQDLKRISFAIEKGSFYDNKAFLVAAAHAKKHNSTLHIMGLASLGSVHSSLDHLLALLQFCRKEDVKSVALHLFTDGRDAPPNAGLDVIKSVLQRMEILKVGRIATLAGRYYSMDRDRRWERTQKAFEAITLGKGVVEKDPVETITKSYAAGKTDEFIEPTVILDAEGKATTVDDNDSVIFFNFRVDRPKQLTLAFILPDFERLKSFDFGYEDDSKKIEGEVKFDQTFKRVKVPKNMFFVTMTEYQKNLPVSAVAFTPEIVSNSLPKVLSDVGFKQLHMSESEKERFVTYYFRGMHEEEFEGEDKYIVPSPKVATYDLKPEMSLPKLVQSFKKELSKNYYKFILLNFANPDMVAHTGNLKASISAIEITDKYLGILVETVLKSEGTVFVTADHGNAEELITYPESSFFYTTDKGTINTDHSNFPVPLIAISKDLQNKKVAFAKGALSDISPTLLSYMGLQIPQEMTGKVLLPEDIKTAPIAGVRDATDTNQSKRH